MGSLSAAPVSGIVGRATAIPSEDLENSKEKG
jgi:hypothetical protein